MMMRRRARERRFVTRRARERRFVTRETTGDVKIMREARTRG
jgi:hypothetical protein